MPNSRSDSRLLRIRQLNSLLKLPDETVYRLLRISCLLYKLFNIGFNIYKESISLVKSYPKIGSRSYLVLSLIL